MKMLPHIIYFLFFINIASVSPVIYAEEQYLKDFRTGLEFYNSKNYENADIQLRKSFELKEHSKTAYFIADANYELGRHVTAKTYAVLALHDLRPTLENDKQEYLRKIISKIDDQAINNYKRVKTIKHRYSITSSENEFKSKDLEKIQAIEFNSKRQIQIAKEELIALGIDPDEIDDSMTTLIPDKCDPNYTGSRTTEEVNSCLAEMLH